MSGHSRDVFRDAYDFSDGEIGRHHEAYRRRERMVEAPTGVSSGDMPGPDEHTPGRESGQSVKRRD